MSDRVGDVGVAVWIALQRAHQGGVTNLAGQWRDSGSPVPGYLADALNRLTSSGQLALGDPDPESCGARRATVTDTGYARYVTLCQVHNSPDSDRQPAETAPGGRPDTTAPVESACVAAGGDPQRGTLGAGQVVINPGAHRGTPHPAGLLVIGSPEAADKALGELFLANADRGDDAANDDLVAELVRRIRAQQDTRAGGRGQQPPSQPTGCRPTPQLPTPQFGNSPNSGRPPVEQFPRPIPAPGGRPDTTTPVDSASLAADVDRGDHPSAGREQPRLGRRHGVMIDRCVALPATSVKPITSPSPELAKALVVQRAHDGGVVKLGADYLDHGFPTPGSLAGVLDELTDTGLLTLAEPDSEGPRPVSLTTAGHTRYEQLRGTPRPPGLRVPAPQFPTRTSARTRLSSPGPLDPPPDGEPDAGCAAGESSVGPLRWARCPDGRLHLLQPTDVVVAATGGQAEALCGHSLPAEGLTLTHGSAVALCLTCLAGTGPRQQRPQPETPGPGKPRPATGDDHRTTARPISDQRARRG